MAVSHEKAGGSLATSTQSTQVGRCKAVTVSLSGTWTGTVVGQRSLDDGVTWGDVSGASWTANVETQFQIGVRPVIFRLDFTRSSGTLVYAIEADDGNSASVGGAASVGGGDATAANQDEQTTELQAINTKLTTIDGRVDGLEALITSTNTKLDAVEGAITTGVATSLPAGTAAIGTVGQTGRQYETVAASQTAQVLGGTGALGDDIDQILVVPATLSPGAITLLDNAISITLFPGGASSVATLHPFPIPLGWKSVSGAWKITTGANVSCIASGKFTA